LGLFCYYTKFGEIWDATGAISEKSSCHEVVSNIFGTNAPGPLLWTLNSCFGEFYSVWVHLGPFRYFAKLGAILAFGVISVKSSCHEVVSDIFATNAPVPVNWTINTYFGEFGSVLVNLGSFHYCTKLCAFWAELVQLVKKVCSTNGHFRNKRTWSIPLDSCFGEFGSVSEHLGSFRYCTNSVQFGLNWCN